MSATARAKDTLLRALDALEAAEHELGGAAERVDLVVTYEVGREGTDGKWHSIGGWSSTLGPKWLHAALLRRAADAQQDQASAVDDGDEEDGDDGD